MDFFSHALWTNAIYYKRKYAWLAVFFGIMPDLFSFGVLFSQNIIIGGFNLILRQGDIIKWEPPALETIPQYIHNLYNITHSLIIFLFIFLIITVISRKTFWPILAWPIHIFIDIFTHSYKFFPTPFLWPVSTYKFDGISWGEPWFMAVNISTLIIVYVWIFIKKKKQNNRTID